MTEEEKWKARLQRERLARKEAEKLLEEKSAELFELNQSLEQKVILELEKNREKELMILQQSKMASLGEMIGNIAHQWRQPLSAVSSIASSHILQQHVGSLSNDESTSMMEDIIEHTKFLSNTIEDFRNFFRSDKTYTNFNLEEAIDKSIKIVSGVLNSRSITLIKKIDDIELFSLKNEFIQVILNLIKNSIDAMDDVIFEDEKFIMIQAHKTKTEVVIEVIDSAGGIPESILEKIFDPYFTTKHQSQGTGIGLFMSLEIIQKHMNGTLEVENKLNKFKENQEYFGAIFRIKIPLEY